jgi:hypothetical protein
MLNPNSISHCVSGEASCPSGIRVVGVTLLVALVLSLAQAQSETQVLEACQTVFVGLKPQFMYAERAGVGRFLFRAALGVEATLSRITLSADWVPVPVGLEDIAVQPLRLTERARIQSLAKNRLASVTAEINLGNWVVQEPKAYRCFLVHRGRVVGWFRLNLRLRPIADPRPGLAYQRSPMRYPGTNSEAPNAR